MNHPCRNGPHWPNFWPFCVAMPALRQRRGEGCRHSGAAREYFARSPPRQSAERLFRAKGNSPERTSRTQADRAFLLLYQCHCERAFRVHLQGKKISNLLATLPPRRRMTVDARAKQVSLLCEFPLRSSNGALNGSLIHRTRDSRAGGVLGPDTFHREARSRV